jgi:hypothetical protein
LLVALLGTPSPVDLVDSFDSAWWMMVAAAFGSAVAFSLVGSLKTQAASVEQEIEAAVASMAPEVAA